LSDLASSLYRQEVPEADFQLNGQNAAPECALLPSPFHPKSPLWFLENCMKMLVLGFIAAILPLPLVAAENVHVSIDASKPGARIDPNLFGQFAENLGHGLYEGIWVGPDSPIPNTRGIRNDVVSALRELKVPNVRWPGGCFADQYHWRKGIGSIPHGAVWSTQMPSAQMSLWISLSRLAATRMYPPMSAQERRKKLRNGWST
jgi:hypothetical protein